MDNNIQNNAGVKQETQLSDKDQEIISNIVLRGNIGGLNPDDKVKYYNLFCHSLHLNPVTQPFQIIKFQGQERLYATKDATEQLRKINGVSVIELKRSFVNNLCVVDAKVQDHLGRVDMATGAVNINGLKGDALANAIMKAETKAKRRATLSICGLGALDESELDTMLPHETKPVEQPPTRELSDDEKNALRKEYESIDVEKVIKDTTTHKRLQDEMHRLEKYISVLAEEEKAYIKHAIIEQRQFLDDIAQQEGSR